jgi:hypothetical protein
MSRRVATNLNLKRRGAPGSGLPGLDDRPRNLKARRRHFRDVRAELCVSCVLEHLQKSKRGDSVGVRRLRRRFRGWSIFRGKLPAVIDTPLQCWNLPRQSLSAAAEPKTCSGVSMTAGSFAGWSIHRQGGVAVSLHAAAGGDRELADGTSVEWITAASP